jgi:CheY-like chemotaxis protein
MVNLGGNAIKFTESGEVEISVRVVEERRGALDLEFSVRDTGIGIEPERRSSVFEAFTQADGATTRKYGGTGLGLAITRRIVELHGGTLDLESELGKGSTFSFRIQSQRGAPDGEHQAEATDSAEALARIKGHRILVVDDNPTNRRMLALTLEGFGCQAHVADGGEQALTALRSAVSRGRPYDLMLLDLQMPGMDGYEVEREVRGRPEYGPPRIVLVSSLGNHGRDSRPSDSHSMFVSKPVRRSSLIEAMSSALRDESMPRAADKPRQQAQPSLEAKSIKVLLVEDHPVNVQLARGMLGKLGCTAVHANSGQAALDALESEAFDLVLMDVQMPVMDGLTATRKIREREAGGSSRVPIIALTAHAMESDRIACLEAGMDGYLSKPIRVAELRDAVNRWSPGSLSASEPGSKGTGDARDAERSLVLDLSGALGRLEGDEDLLRLAMECFTESAPEMQAEIRAGAVAQDGKSVREAAHGLRGAAAGIGGDRVRSLAEQIERAGARGNIARVDELIGELESQLDELIEAIEDYQQSKAR